MTNIIYDYLLLECSYVLVESSSGAAIAQPDQMGLYYCLNTTSGGKLVYKHVENGMYLFFSISSYAWIVRFLFDKDHLYASMKKYYISHKIIKFYNYWILDRP